MTSNRWNGKQLTGTYNHLILFERFHLLMAIIKENVNIMLMIMKYEFYHYRDKVHYLIFDANKLIKIPLEI
jgi:hypothetical protein